VLVFEVFSFGGFPFEAMYEDSTFLKFIGDRSKDDSPDAGAELHKPLLVQLAAVLKRHGLPKVPSVAEMLISGCVVIAEKGRFTFAELARRTSRAAIAVGDTKVMTIHITGAAAPAGKTMSFKKGRSGTSSGGGVSNAGAIEETGV
jgi:hypothetical protein